MLLLETCHCVILYMATSSSSVAEQSIATCVSASSDSEVEDTSSSTNSVHVLNIYIRCSK